MSHKQTRASSNYARHNKSPYRYSDLYKSWHDAAVGAGSNVSERALELDAAFRRREGLAPRRPDNPDLYAQDAAEAEARR
jgi:hypothetical protein